MPEFSGVFPEVPDEVCLTNGMSRDNSYGLPLMTEVRQVPV